MRWAFCGHFLHNSFNEWTIGRRLVTHTNTIYYCSLLLPFPPGSPFPCRPPPPAGGRVPGRTGVHRNFLLQQPPGRPPDGLLLQHGGRRRLQAQDHARQPRGPAKGDLHLHTDLRSSSLRGPPPRRRLHLQAAPRHHRLTQAHHPRLNGRPSGGARTRRRKRSRWCGSALSSFL